MLPLVVVNQYVWCCFSTVLPPSGVLKFTGWLPGLFPRPLKVMTMRLYSEKGTSPGTVAWLRSPGNVNVCLSPWLFFKSTRLRSRHQFIWIRRWKNTDINFVSVFKQEHWAKGSKVFGVCLTVWEGKQWDGQYQRQTRVREANTWRKVRAIPFKLCLKAKLCFVRYYPVASQMSTQLVLVYSCPGNLDYWAVHHLYGNIIRCRGGNCNKHTLG